MFEDIVRFYNPDVLYLLVLVVPMVGYYVYRERQRGAAVELSTAQQFRSTNKHSRRTVRYYLRHVMFMLRLAIFALVIVALARPQTSESNQKTTVEGIDIVMVLDISSSMLARDFKPDRITAAVDITSRFITERENDRIGIVIFAGESFTLSPLTTDHTTLINQLQGVRCGMIEDGTAIGNGLAVAVNRLKESGAKSRVVILLTDGVNNRGLINPVDAAQIAKQYGIRVYTIGVGTKGMAPMLVIDKWERQSFQMQKVEIDEDMLTKIAQLTDGEYFRAQNNNSLSEIYQRINTLEKAKIEVDSQTLYFEKFQIFLLAAIALLAVEMLLRYTIFRQLP